MSECLKQKSYVMTITEIHTHNFKMFLKFPKDKFQIPVIWKIWGFIYKQKTHFWVLFFFLMGNILF